MTESFVTQCPNCSTSFRVNLAQPNGTHQALADAGVPAHTLAVAFGFPDYHGKDDTWDKIDYDNMARVNRMIARRSRLAISHSVATSPISGHST